jgi:hypothetical protein
LFVSGLLLAAHSLKLNGVVAINGAFKSIAQQALMLGLVGFVSIGNPLAGEAVVAPALPSAVIVPMLAGQYGIYQAEGRIDDGFDGGANDGCCTAVHVTDCLNR